MDEKVLQILMIDDSEDDYILTRMALMEVKGQSFQIDWVFSFEEGLEALNKQAHDICLIDYRLGARDGLELVKTAFERQYKTPIIFMTGHGSETVAVEAMKLGVQDYLVKGQFNGSNLNRTINNAIEKVTLRHKINQQQKQLEQYQIRMMSELEQAQEAQLALLPQQLPEFPGVKIARKFMPMGRVGGDCYDILKLDEVSLGLLVADVTGHGITASLISFMISGLFKTLALQCEQTGETFTELNDALDGHITEDKFASAFYAIFDIPTQSLTYTSAGHPPMFLIRAQEQSVLPLSATNPLLGIYPKGELDYNEETLQLYPGDKLFLYTDGVIECHNTEGELFDEHELQKFLHANRSFSIDTLIEKVYHHLCDFTLKEVDMPFNDDLTFLGIEILELPPAY